eukprot:6170318-Prymnesium_polylepis.3
MLQRLLERELRPLLVAHHEDGLYEFVGALVRELLSERLDGGVEGAGDEERDERVLTLRGRIGLRAHARRRVAGHGEAARGSARLHRLVARRVLARPPPCLGLSKRSNI